MNLQLIKGGTTENKPKVDYASIYLNAYIRAAKQWFENHKNRQALYQMVFYGIKYIIKEEEIIDKDILGYQFQFIKVIREAISQLTPSELTTIFPVSKTYDGKRWETKDYFFTMDMLKEIGMDIPIGDKVDDLLWDYQNIDITLLNVTTLSIISNLRQLEGKKNLIEEFFGVKGCTLQKDRKGKEYLVVNETGKVTRFRRKLPRYLRLVAN